MKVAKIRTNIMGTISFSAKFKGMRKEQEFIVYPNPQGELKIQSDTRCGIIQYDGSARIANVKYFMKMTLSNLIDDSVENIEELKNEIRQTSGNNVGNSGVSIDNSTASFV